MTGLATERTKKTVPFNLNERLNALHLHWAGVAALAAVNLYLLVSLGFLWQQSKAQDADALAQQRVALAIAVQASKPLEGLDGKIATANGEANDFYEERLPVGYSEIASEIGVLLKKNNVRLTRIQYAQAPVADVSLGQLTEVRMDASLGGDYRGLVEFLNGLERDRQFFLIDGVQLTGQESGRVNLRMKLTTYLRGRGSDEEAARASTPGAVAVSDEMRQQVESLAGSGTGGHR
jgi:hypothetical protein